MKKSSWLIILSFLAPLVFAAACGDDDDDNAPSDDDAVDDDVDDDAIDDDEVDDDAIDDDAIDDDSIDDDTVDDDSVDDDSVEYLVPPNTVFQVEGTDSLYGDYAGVVEIRGPEDEPNFIRLIHYDNLTFADPRREVDYAVHTAWTGNIDLVSGYLKVELQVADFITNYEDVTRAPEDGQPVIIEGSADPDRQGFTTQLASVGSHAMTVNETWSAPQPAGAQPLFVFEDTYVASHESPPDWLKTLVNAIFNEYHQMEFFDPYRDREEFKAYVHYMPHFRTDFQWYRDNPDAIRVVNKWLDKVSMVETMVRARGYSQTLGDKATQYDADMPVLFLNPVGFVSSAEVPSDPLNQRESGDGLLWNGCYLASQVFRWLVTGDQDAFDNWLRILDAQFLAHDIVQDDTTFARSVRPHVADGAKDWIAGTPPYEAYDWLAEGNNDMIQGLYYAYTLSWIFLPDEPAYDEYRAKIAERALRLADYCSVANDDGFNEIKATWLAWMTTGDATYQTRYQELWSKFTLQFWAGGGDGMFYIYGISDWSGQHLDTIGHLILYFLALATGDPGLSTILNGWNNGMLFNGVTRQALWPIAAYAFADPPASYQPVLDEALWVMREFPYPKQNFPTDMRIDPKWCASPLPSLPWKLDWMEGGRLQGIYGLPMWERGVSTCDWVAGPFDWANSETNWTDGGGQDFLHAYWLGRYYGVIAPED